MNPYRHLPRVDDILKWPELAGRNRPQLLAAIRESLDACRARLKRSGASAPSRPELLEEILRRYARKGAPSLQPVVNATGVILHTNLGRAPLDSELFDEARRVAEGYCNLEYDLRAGKRGDRHRHVAGALRELLGVEDALVVNNNAAAVFLILHTFAGGRETILSRGELVEIGGSFRIPEVMAASGTRLREVGTTNRTRLSDYEGAISPETALLMKVHTSNYTIEGFSGDVPMETLSALARKRGLIDYYDLGSAWLPDLPWGLGRDDPALGKILKRAPSLLSFSGDKLFGGPQAGIILGRRELIAELRRNQLLRMFRVDKLTLALLERTVLACLREEYDRIPVLRMLFTTPERLRERAEALRARLPLPSRIEASETFVGGGTLPNRPLPTVVIALEGDPERLEEHFRRRRIIGRIERGRFVLDLRTVEEREFDRIVDAAKELG